MKKLLLALLVVVGVAVAAYSGVRILESNGSPASTPASQPVATAPAPSAAAPTSAAVPRAFPEPAPAVSGALPSIGESTGPLSAPAAPPSAPAAPAGPPLVTPGPPATTTTTDVAADAMGGEIEQLTGVFGPGFIGRRLLDEQPTPTWKLDSLVTYPQEAVFSFFDRERALVSAVAIDLPDDASRAPKDVEVWASPENPDSGFVRMAAQTLAPRGGEQTITFPAANARFVKLRILSGNSDNGLEIANVRVLEAAREGYVPLSTRRPDVKSWDGSPRQAGQHGLDWMQQAATIWPKDHNCFGCHVQAQALMGQAIALKQDYRVNLAALHALTDSTRQFQETDGQTPGGKRFGDGTNSWFGSSTSATVFAVMALAYADTVTGAANDQDLVKGIDFLIARQQPDGAFPIDRVEPPIIQGNFMTTANTLVALDWAVSHSRDPKYKTAAARAISWMAAATPESTQDKVFKIIGLMRDGAADQHRLAWPIVQQLAAEQQNDGGWKERPQEDGSNALATGEVLYAFKQAGVGVESPAFRRGVAYLLKTQVRDGSTDDGSWKQVNSQSGRTAPLAHTMWAVIGLAGSFGVSNMGDLEIQTHGNADKPPSRNLEIVLDVSGSMNSRLGTSTRWKTALDTLKQLLDALPDDFNVGLRVYGHRYPASSHQSCSDSQLVVPIEKIDRAKILSTASALHPRGETPLVSSVLQTMDDLHTAGSGSVILITDGEESCHGNLQDAAAKLKASNVGVTLSIVGFTLTGKQVAAQLGSLAESTGGRFYSAQSGSQLSRALTLASMQHVPYEVIDASGRTVVSNETSDLGQALPPGTYRVRVHIGGQDLEAPATIVANKATILRISLEGDRFVMQ